MALPFRQVNVFSATPTGGNPLAVVHDAEGLTDEQMAAFARWTNLSETTFLLPPTDPAADYRVRIFTPVHELPFAGHPTLGTAHAWLEAGGVPAGEDVVQECGVGLVTVRRGTPAGDAEPARAGSALLAFAAPPLLRSGPVAEEDRSRVARALGIDAADIVRAAWVDNGPGWVGVQLRDAEAVLALRIDAARFDDLAIGVVGPHSPADRARLGADVEVRAFVPGLGAYEDPVTGSLNAGLGQWLAGAVLPPSYVAAQGTLLGREGRAHVTKDDDGEVWVAGGTVTTIVGEVGL
ncbi:PhzF family phenazine biosynthesis protein [Myceligenerans pegani]|uniref:PhzF family phenazine biosynthesis protein n=1 Tax=Myceligenerans pegani TaxID=2776917 RepID=A0ABR9N300_9MICO|nr:PhzF family phenazine biosynthesis protein [Myceligenerans sp. TRM 65318]MBE1878029.1 PhzF family phenazine biosynthesis protein [Myceligenerans sp. TRM 65318]MBE3020300.1 PhzF family phenazine biosynthesis protein [Myceligenerans sp. TRM 65318]